MSDTCVRNSLLSDLMYYLFIDFFVCLHWKFVCLHCKNPRFTALDSKLHTRLAIVTANELGLAFSPRNLLKKFRPDPSTFYLVIVPTDRQTDRQTYAGDYIIPRESFRGDNDRLRSDAANNRPTGAHDKQKKKDKRWRKRLFI